MFVNKYDDYIEECLNEAEVVLIPYEFVSAACVTDLEGNEYIVELEEVEELFDDEEGLSAQGIESVRCVIDMELVKQTVRDLSEDLLKVLYA